VPPFLDLRYVTSYTNDGATTSCHTFQRRFSRRYLQYRSDGGTSGTSSSGLVAPQEQPACALAGSSARADAGQELAGADLVVAPEGKQPENAAAAEYAAAEAATEAVQLDDGALADSERILGRTLGPVHPSLKMAARKAAHTLVQYVQRAHLLTLRGLVCEFARDTQGHLWFLGPLRTDWASLIPGGWLLRGGCTGDGCTGGGCTGGGQAGRGWAGGQPDIQRVQRMHALRGAPCRDQHPPGGCVAVCAAPRPAGRGGEPWANANLTQQPRDEASWPSTVGEEAEEQAAGVGQGCAAGEEPQEAACAGGSSSSINGACQRQLHTTQHVGSSDLPDHLALPPPVLQQGQLPGSPQIAAIQAALPSLGGSSPPARLPGSPGAAKRASPQQQLALKVAAGCSSPGQAGLQRDRSPGASGRQQQQLYTASSPTGGGSSGCAPWGTGPGCGGGSTGGQWGTAHSASLSSHLTKELVSLKDELLVKADLAEALADKVERCRH
jgi:hypothetical protein